jgi:hypothetical protein
MAELMRIHAVVLATVAASLVASAAQAASPVRPPPSQERTAQEKAARKACLSGDFEKGVSILSDLFVETRDPTYIFNQARCFEQNRRYDDAIARFQEYLRAAPELSAEDRAITEKHIADCQQILDKQSSHAATPVAPSPAAPVVASSPVPAVPTAQTPAAAIESAPTPAPAPGAGLRIAGIATASVGVAALVTGVILNLKVNSMASDLEGLGQYSDSKESQRKTYQTLGWVGYGAGAACVATGAVLYYLGVRAGQSPPAVALLPMLSGDLAGAAVGGRF